GRGAAPLQRIAGRIGGTDGSCYGVKMRKLAMLLTGGVFVAAVNFTWPTLTGQSLTGRRAPSFALPDSTLKAYDILDYRGCWLLLDFMKTDCPACKALTKTLEGIKTRL